MKTGNSASNRENPELAHLRENTWWKAFTPVALGQLVDVDAVPEHRVVLRDDEAVIYQQGKDLEGRQN